MEVINITDEQKNNLCQELAKLVFELKKDNEVECIYFVPYKGLGDIRGNVLEVTLVKQSDNDVNNDIAERNRFYFEEENKAIGGMIDLSEGPKLRYDSKFGPKDLNFDFKIINPY